MRTPLALVLALCLAALAACGGDSPSTAARKAAQGYVKDLGARDGDAVCADMSDALQGRFVTAMARANPEVTGLTCGEIMAQALRSLPPEQLDAFATAKIEDVKVKGKSGTFVYRLHDLAVHGKVGKLGKAWKVSCCVPGQS